MDMRAAGIGSKTWKLDIIIANKSIWETQFLINLLTKTGDTEIDTNRGIDIDA